MNTHDLSAAHWRKSSRCAHDGGQCVEVAGLTSVVAVRDSADRAGPALILTATTWHAFATRVRNGEYELS